jgi:uncharacterized membrane protein YecN with MAPEG domain
MSLPITTGFVLIFTLIYVALSLIVVRTRRKNKISLGDGNHPQMIKIISTHSNFSQYVPLGLIGILLGELQGVSSKVLIGLGIALLLGRIFHAIGIVLSKPGPNLARVWGMVLTFFPLLLLAIASLIKFR